MLLDEDPRRDSYVEELHRFFRGEDDLGAFGILYADSGSAKSLLQTLESASLPALIVSIGVSSVRYPVAWALAAFFLLLLALLPGPKSLRIAVLLPWVASMPLLDPIASFPSVLVGYALIRALDSWESMIMVIRKYGLKEIRRWGIPLPPKDAMAAGIAGVCAAAIAFDAIPWMLASFASSAAWLAFFLVTPPFKRRFVYIPIGFDRKAARPSSKGLTVAMLIAWCGATIVGNPYSLDSVRHGDSGTGVRVPYPSFTPPINGDGSILPNRESYIVHVAMQEGMPFARIDRDKRIASLEQAVEAATFPKFTRNAEQGIIEECTLPNIDAEWVRVAVEQSTGLGIERYLFAEGTDLSFIYGPIPSDHVRLATAPSLMYILLLAVAAFAVWRIIALIRSLISIEGKNEEAKAIS
jgi:hypothetical protein